MENIFMHFKEILKKRVREGKDGKLYEPCIQHT